MASTAAEREQLRRLVHQWNENRLDLFSLSEPNEDLEFHGVMRYYFQEAGQKVATKCIRVSSTATARAVIDALVEKFHPDLKMLTTPTYSIWEVHEGGDERRLAPDEKPLLVQLNWHKDDREGRFLLKREGADQYLPLAALQLHDANESDMKRGSLKRFSKRDKRDSKKKQQRETVAARQNRPSEAEDVGVKLYQEVPTTTFTRTISNPEIVMKKRRERKLESKLKEMGKGGSLKIYGTELSPSKPYVTLLVSVRDRADKIVKETLEKYGLERHDPSDFCLAEVILPHSENEYKSESVGQLTPIGERFLEDDDCPLMLLANRPANVTENIIFQVRRRPDSMSRPRRRHLSSSSASAVRVVSPGNRAMDPCLVELSADGTDVPGNPRVFRVLPNVTELGSDRALTQMGVQSFPLQGPYVHPRHCVLAFMDGVVTLTPCTPTAEIEINGQPIVQTTILRDRFVIRIGRSHVFRFFEHGAQGAPFASVPRSQSQPFNDQKGDDNNERRTLTIDSGRRSVGRESSNVSVEYVDSHTWPRRNGPADSTSPTHKEPKLVAIQLETTFDVDGTIETCALSPGLQGGCDVKEIVSSDRLFAPSPAPQLRPHPTARDSIPAIVELLDNVEDEFLYAVIRDVDPERQQFKLSPVYVLYMACRYRLSPHYRTSLLAEERAAMLANFLAKTTNMLHVTIQDHCHSTDALAFWMANSSELLNLVKLDRVIGPVTNPEPQESLADAVEKAFGHLTSCLREELQAAMPAVLDPSLDDSSAAGPCLHMLASAMKLLRYCRLNAALTIQLFSQLFHFINMYLFNWLVSIEGSSYCSRAWGQRLAARIGRIQEWAEKQGLELAAECHLDRIVQAVKLLQTPKTMDQLATLGATCYKLNSLQVRNLLERYHPEMGEAAMPLDLIDNVAKVAENQADEMLRCDGRNLQVEEDVDLHLPFLLPEDGYSPEVVRGVPPGLKDFVDELQHRGVCRMIPQPGSTGTWKVHLIGSVGGLLESSPLRQMSHDGSPISQRQAEIVQISFHKGTGGIGLSIVAAQGIGDRDVGIYVKKVVAGSVADKDGRLEAGDQLLSVNGQPLIGITQEEAAQKMAKAGPDLCFEVSKQAAMYNGLATWLYQPSPQVMHVPPGGGIPHTLPNGIPPSNYAKANGGTNGYAGVAPQARFGSVSSLQHQQQQQQPYMAQTQSSSGMNGGGPRQARFQPGPAAATFRQAPPPQTEPIQRHNRSASASELFHNQQTQSNRSSQHSVASLPRGAVVPAQQQHQQMQQQQQQQYHNLPGHYRPNQHISQTGVGPLLHQPPSSARSLPPLGHPISRNAVDPGHTERSQSPSALYRRPPSADVTASQVYRARIPSTASTSSSVFYPQSALTDYQNLPLIADTVNETTFPSDPAQSHYAHLSTARSAHPISHDLNPMQAASSALVHQQHQQQPQSNGDAVYSLSRAQEPFQPPPASVGEQMRQRSTSVDVSPPQPHLSGRTSVPLYGNDTQQVENEVLRLMKEEMTRLENKPQLTEAEDRRYRALLFEIAYQTRLHEDERGSSSRSSSNDFSSTQPPPPSSTLVDHGRLTNASSSSPTVIDSPAATAMSAAQRQQQREQYFAEAESKLLEEAARQQHTAPGGGVSRSPEHANWSPHHQQQNSHSVEPPTMLPPPTLMGELQQQMQQVLLVDNGESYQNSSPSPPSKEPSVVGKRPPPEVPPKHRRVQFTEPSGSLPEETTTNGVEEQTDLAKRYVFQEEEIEAPRVQVLGTQEVYRDPRQRRLNDMESKEQMKKSKTDGANLGFRDKMKLFAQQIGEQAPKNRVKASSAQREIEDQLDHSQ